MPFSQEWFHKKPEYKENYEHYCLIFIINQNVGLYVLDSWFMRLWSRNWWGCVECCESVMCLLYNLYFWQMRYPVRHLVQKGFLDGNNRDEKAYQLGKSKTTDAQYSNFFGRYS